jgi:2'-5' RNA ligase
MGDSVVLAAGPVAPLRELRDRVWRATATAGVAPRLEAGVEFSPHVSLCYLNDRTDCGRVLEAVAAVPETRTEVSCDRVTQVLVNRTEGHYSWRAQAELSLG